jgi:Formyltetrahydrofolate synthetase
MNVEVSECRHWAEGGKGASDLAKKVVKICKKKRRKFNLLYKNNLKLWDKIELIAKEIYKASNITANKEIIEQLKIFENNGYGHLPVCIAKTQYSFSTDPKLKGAPSNHEIPVREIRLSSGAEFIVVVCGSIMTMPGLPRVPAADTIRLNKKGETEGLF